MERFRPEALPIDGRHLIEASAGTGKTYALMSLLIRAIAVHGHPPEQCLLMTFTRASTRELRARVRERLASEITLLQADQSELPKAFSGFSTDVGIIRLHDALRKIDSIEIRTIHGFAIRVVHDFGPAVGIPSFPVETDSSELRQEVVIDCYRQLIKECGAKNVLALTGGLKAFITHAQLAWKPIEDIIPPNTECPDLGMIASGFKARKTSIEPTIGDLAGLNGLDKTAVRRHASKILDAQTRRDIPEDTIKYFLKREEEHEGTVFDDWVGLIKPCQTESEFRAYCLRELRALYAKRLAERGITDNDQVVRDAALVASRLEANGPSHTVILIDEFQDTDRHQWAMLDQLYPDSPGRLMVMVGDPKQAIYRFRGADTTFYHNVRNTFAQEFCWYLETVYRSTESVVEGLNELFTEELPIGEEHGYRSLATGSLGSRGALVVNDHKLAGFQWVDTLTPERVVELTQCLLNHSRSQTRRIDQQILSEKDLCILVQSRSTAQKIKHIGERRGLAFHYHSNSSIFTRAVAREMVCILEAIANPDDLSAITTAASTRLMGLKLNTPLRLTEQPKFKELQTALFNSRDQWNHDGPMFALTCLFESCQTAQRFPNNLSGLEDWNILTQCLEIFGEEAKGLTPLQAAQWWAGQAQQSAEAREQTVARAPSGTNIVTISTIHGSKGLEYNVVILADQVTAKSLPKTTWGFDYCDKNESKIDLTASAREHALRDQKKDLNRLLYVALTRAKSAVFCGFPDPKGAVSRLLNQRAIDSLGQHHEVFEIPASSKPFVDFATPIEEPVSLRRPLAPEWFFRSFSGLISHETSQEVEPGASDEDPVDTEFDLNQKWHAISGGTGTGNFIHEILEWHANCPRGGETLQQYIETRWPNHLPPEHLESVSTWIQHILSVELFPETSLHNLSARQKRAEPQFELPLKTSLKIHDLFEACGNFSWWRPQPPPKDYQINGHLIGFIDLVFEADKRFHIIDYKTNYLGPNDDAYSDDRIESAMEQSHYHLQAAIYGLALHRWLQKRLPEYDPTRHLGDVIYLFCRGVQATNQGIWRRSIETDGVIALEEHCLCTP